MKMILKKKKKKTLILTNMKNYRIALKIIVDETNMDKDMDILYIQIYGNLLREKIVKCRQYIIK